MSVARRRFIQGTAVATGAALLPTVPAYAADPVTIEADGITLVGRGDGSVLVRDGAGTDRILLSHFMIKDTALGQQRTFGGTPARITLPDGRPAIQVTYTMGSGASGVTVRGTFDVTPRKAHMKWEVGGAGTLTPAGFMFSRTVYGASAAESYEALTVWEKDARGGIPYEVNAGGAYVETWPESKAFFCLPSTNPANTNATWIHSPARRPARAPRSPRPIWSSAICGRARRERSPPRARSAWRCGPTSRSTSTRRPGRR